MSTSVLGAAARIHGETKPDPALAAAVEAAARLPGADIAGVLLTDDAGETATMHACAGRWTVHSLNLRVRRGHGLAGRILHTRRPWKVDDYTCDRSIKADDFALILADDGTGPGWALRCSRATSSSACSWPGAAARARSTSRPRRRWSRWPTSPRSRSWAAGGRRRRNVRRRGSRPGATSWPSASPPAAAAPPSATSWPSS